MRVFDTHIKEYSLAGEYVYIVEAKVIYFAKR
jgi:hypothetical protein